MRYDILGLIVMLGVIDFVNAGFARVELTSKGSETLVADIPVQLFPCSVSEGDIFHIEISDGVTEIRCGDPDI